MLHSLPEISGNQLLVLTSGHKLGELRFPHQVQRFIRSTVPFPWEDKAAVNHPSNESHLGATVISGKNTVGLIEECSGFLECCALQVGGEFLSKLVGHPDPIVTKAFFGKLLFLSDHAQSESHHDRAG
jgi:hypothetical protein